jgi:lysyl-tRNA synthetase, class II
MAEERLAEIRQARLAKRAAALKEGLAPYPAEARRTHAVAEFVKQLDALVEKSIPTVLVGRLTAERRHGGVVFFDITDASGKTQLQVTKEGVSPEMFQRLEQFDVGDFVQTSGKAGRTKRGEAALIVAEVHMLSKSIRPLPSSWHGLRDHEKRFRRREIDLLLNTESHQTQILRSKIIAWLRKYLIEQGYLEVDTPVLQSIAGGAAARPFATHHNALDIPLYLRVSAELPLKRLLVAGYEKVFEIGRRFRNEGIDRHHNPEFTMLESQWAYADYEDLMDFTEETLDKLCREILGTTDVTWQDHALSFGKPLPRLRYVDIVSERLGVDILKEKEPGAYLPIFEKEGLELPEAHTYTRLIDELYKELVRPNIIQPTLLYDYPADMVPLAKSSLTDPRIAEQFQLLAVGAELNTCYTEQNDPVLQRAAFEMQQRDREAGDEEAHRVDEEYLTAMEHGMPPNAGWSLGIDRFVMLLTNSPSVRDTIAFPLLRPK